MDTPTEVLARRLKAARALTGKKVRDIVGELGWSDEKLYRLERGDQVPDALELATLATLYGQTLDFFLAPTSSDGNGETLSQVADADNAEVPA